MQNISASSTSKRISAPRFTKGTGTRPASWSPSWTGTPAAKSDRGTEAPTGTWDPEETTSVDEGPIIAYGSLFIDQSSTGGKMIDVQLPLNYYDTKAKPSGLYQIVISCSTSAYGDFMAGCKSNILYVDNFEWVY